MCKYLICAPTHMYEYRYVHKFIHTYRQTPHKCIKIIRIDESMDMLPASSSLFLALSRTLPRGRSRSLSGSHLLSLALSHSHSLSDAFIHSQSRSLVLSRSLSLFQVLSRTVAFAFSLALVLLSLSASCALSLALPLAREYALCCCHALTCQPPAPRDRDSAPEEQGVDS